MPSLTESAAAALPARAEQPSPWAPTLPVRWRRRFVETWREAMALYALRAMHGERWERM